MTDRKIWVINKWQNKRIIDCCKDLFPYFASVFTSSPTFYLHHFTYHISTFYLPNVHTLLHRHTTIFFYFFVNNYSQSVRHGNLITSSCLFNCHHHHMKKKKWTRVIYLYFYVSLQDRYLFIFLRWHTSYSRLSDFNFSLN